jgi:hypothetical protein
MSIPESPVQNLIVLTIMPLVKNSSNVKLYVAFEFWLSDGL